MAQRPDGSFEHGDFDGFNPKFHEMQRQQKAVSGSSLRQTSKIKPVVIARDYFADVKPMTPEERRRSLRRFFLVIGTIAGMIILLIYLNNR